ncbi:MAG: nucleotide exchange factor GrpE [Armatimonadota bacterium]
MWEAEKPECETTVGTPGAENTSGTAEATVEEALQAELEDLRRRLEEQERKSKENHEQYLRALADLDNYRRRAKQREEELVQYANQELLAGLLPILDNFERALAAAEEAHSFESLKEGVSLILRQMQDFLAKNGVSPVEAVGRPFDPSVHEAVLQAPASEQHPAGTVVQEIRRGYTLKGRLLRAALVAVAKEQE